MMKYTLHMLLRWNNVKLMIRSKRYHIFIHWPEKYLSIVEIYGIKVKLLERPLLER